jgi:hypothetical protein
MAKMLKEEFDPQGYKINTRELTQRCVLKVAAMFDPVAAHAVDKFAWEHDLDNSRSKQVLGINYTPVKESVVDMAYSMFKTGAVQDKRTCKKLGTL